MLPCASMPCHVPHMAVSVTCPATLKSKIPEVKTFFFMIYGQETEYISMVTIKLFGNVKIRLSWNKFAYSKAT